MMHILEAKKVQPRWAWRSVCYFGCGAGVGARQQALKGAPIGRRVLLTICRNDYGAESLSIEGKRVWASSSLSRSSQLPWPLPRLRTQMPGVAAGRARAPAAGPIAAREPARTDLVLRNIVQQDLMAKARAAQARRAALAAPATTAARVPARAATPTAIPARSPGDSLAKGGRVRA